MTSSCRQIGLLLGPWLIGVLALTIGPMIASAFMSCMQIDSLSVSDWHWIGTSHYTTALDLHKGDPRLALALQNSLLFSALAVPLGLCASLGVALLLNREAPGMSIVRAIVYLPNLLGGVATIVIWSWLFNPQFGYVNRTLQWAIDGIDPIVRTLNNTGTSSWQLPHWLYDPHWCKPVVILLHVWMMGGSMLIFLAALRRLPRQRLQAATLDGAGAFSRFIHVTLPAIAPAGLFNLVLTTVFAMQSFNEAYILQNRAQQDGLLFYVLYLYEVAFEPPYQLGYAAALGWILFGVLVLLVGPILLLSKRWVHYAGDDISA